MTDARASHAAGIACRLSLVLLVNELQPEGDNGMPTPPNTHMAPPSEAGSLAKENGIQALSQGVLRCGHPKSQVDQHAAVQDSCTSCCADKVV